MNEKPKSNDINERAFQFALKIIKLVSRLPRSIAGIEIGKQIIKAGTSIGANSEEAAGGRTKKDFINSMNIAKKEARETKYWLKLIIGSNMLNDSETKTLLDESEELIKILTSIVKTSEENV